MNLSVKVGSSLVLLFCSAFLMAGQWSVKPEMPTERQEIYADSADGMIYVPGGILTDVVTTTSVFEAFDVKANRWLSLAPLPSPRHHITPAIIGNQLYAIGGFDGPFPEWEMKADMFIYDIQRNTWKKGESLPEPQGEHISVVVDNKIHVIGGRVTTGEGKSHFDAFIDTRAHNIYDPKTGKWSRGAEALTARNSAGAAVVEGLLYVVGGRRNVEQPDGKQLQQNIGTLEVYDAKTNSWKTLTPMPEALGGIAVTASGGKLYVMGGEQWAPEHKVFSSVWVYDPKTDSWHRESELLTARHGLAAASVNGVVYSIGGCTVVGGGAAVGKTEALTEASSVATNQQ